MVETPLKIKKNKKRKIRKKKTKKRRRKFSTWTKKGVADQFFVHNWFDIFFQWLDN